MDNVEDDDDPPDDPNLVKLTYSMVMLKKGSLTQVIRNPTLVYRLDGASKGNGCIRDDGGTGMPQC
ncbi:hypothetical protein Taro_000533 [Colocasia esculenta]|uniref:Uncharacterized protein n=1 Tax=Colocasia esculenta TaxID=4460 RepID=A0A843TDB7_COLES|nr:hypothetical protein [Colocasia esculenta]